MSPNRRISSMFLGLVLIATPVKLRAQAGREQGQLTVSLTDNGGSTARGTLSVKSRDGQLVYTDMAEGHASVRLPYGDYLVEFEGPFFASVSRAITIDKPDCFLQLASVFVPPEQGITPVSITIAVDPPSSCTAEGILWAKLVGVYSQEQREERISPHGYALFEPIPSGSYVILVVDGAKVRANVTVETKSALTDAKVHLTGCE